MVYQRWYQLTGTQPLHRYMASEAAPSFIPVLQAISPCLPETIYELSRTSTETLKLSWNKYFCEALVCVWDSNTGRKVATLEGHGGIAHSCAWSPDGTRLAFASDDDTVRVWDVTHGREIVKLTGHEVRQCRLKPVAPRSENRQVSALGT